MNKKKERKKVYKAIKKGKVLIVTAEEYKTMLTDKDFDFDSDFLYIAMPPPSPGTKHTQHLSLIHI